MPAANRTPLTPEQAKRVADNERLVWWCIRRRKIKPSDEAAAFDRGLDALIRCARGFDVERGFQFSTYATRSILSAVSKPLSGRNAFESRVQTGWDFLRIPEKPEDEEAKERLASMRRFIELLDVREQTVLTLRYGLKGVPRMTLTEVGECLDLSRERVRQIEGEAIADLRRLMSA